MAVDGLPPQEFDRPAMYQEVGRVKPPFELAMSVMRSFTGVEAARAGGYVPFEGGVEVEGLNALQAQREAYDYMYEDLNERRSRINPNMLAVVHIRGTTWQIWIKRGGIV